MIKHAFFKSLVLIITIAAGTQMFYGQEVEWPKHQIKFSPIRVVNLFSPGFELSYELSHKQFSTQLSAAYLTDVFGVVPRGSNLSGYRVNLEEKYFFGPFTKKRRSYVSAELGYNYVDMTVYSEFVPHDFLNESWELQEENVYWNHCDLDRKSIIGN